MGAEARHDIDLDGRTRKRNVEDLAWIDAAVGQSDVGLADRRRKAGIAAQIGAGRRVLGRAARKPGGEALLALASMGKSDAEAAGNGLAAQAFDASDLIEIGDDLGVF